MSSIEDIKTNLTAKKIQGIALDIDETLSWTIGYWVENMQKKFGNPENLTIKELIEKYRYSQNVPYWQTETAMKWMEKHRNSNEIQEVLPLIENANIIVQKINKIIPVVAYITTRPTSVIDGTKKWLKKHEFPDVEIIARPLNIHLSDGNKWKADVLEKLYPQIMGIIDDNPEVVNHLSGYYEGTVLLYDSKQSPRNDIRIIPCSNWEIVLKKIQSTFVL